jgi:protein-S-isoprenylcysteine O-methyltransferase Ste14
MAASKLSKKKSNNIFLNYKPPKELRALFIIHYAPILLIIMIGPITAIYGIWQLPIDMFSSIIIGIIVFIIGAFVYFKWEIFWTKTYEGQLVTDGIFKRIRHPHYTSILIIGFSLAFFFYSIFALFIAFITIPIMVISILDEEKLLIKQYGEEYKRYMEEVPYRIIPGIY